eukprot:gene19531-biopygen6140
MTGMETECERSLESSKDRGHFADGVPFWKPPFGSCLHIRWAWNTRISSPRLARLQKIPHSIWIGTASFEN